ncbi:hypothetical protein KA005_01005 [bacterium]|nr:hypothetical protein [bacterium]
MTEQQKVYVVHLSITELVRGTNQSTKGNALTGLWVRGTVLKDGITENWEKFLMDWNAADSIATIEQAGVGAQVDIRMLKEGRFWNIQSVTNMGQATAPAPAPVTQAPVTQAPVTQAPEGPPAQTEMFESAPVPAPVSVVAPLAIDVKAVALNKAVDLTVGMMANGVLKGTKVTPQIVHEGVIILAERIVDYFENNGAVTPKSDTSPLEREPGCDDGQGDPGVGEDDIPF